MATSWVRTALSSLVVQAANAAKSAASLVLLVQEVDEDGDTFEVQLANDAKSASSKVLLVQNVDEDGDTAVVQAANDAKTATSDVLLVQNVDPNGEALTTQQADTVSSNSSLVLLTQPIDATGAIIEGGGGGSGSGVSSGGYSVAQNDFSAAYTSATTLTLTGLPFTPNDSQWVNVEATRSDGTKETFAKGEDYGFSFVSSTGVLTVTGATFAATDTAYDVTILGTPKAYDIVGNQNIVYQTNPIWEQYDRSTLADVSPGADGTYHYYVSMNGYTISGYMLDLDGGSGTCTVTFEGTWEDGADITALNYRDITNDVFGAASFTADDELVDNDRALSTCTYVRVKVVAATGGADDASWTIEHKKLYA